MINRHSSGLSSKVNCQVGEQDTTIPLFGLEGTGQREILDSSVLGQRSMVPHIGDISFHNKYMLALALFESESKSDSS